MLALAGKKVEIASERRALELEREEAEADLQLLGLLVFQNKVKDGSAEAI